MFRDDGQCSNRQNMIRLCKWERVVVRWHAESVREAGGFDNRMDQ